MQKGDARRTREWSGADGKPCVTCLIWRRGLLTLSDRQIEGPVAICVFRVHLLASALKFLLRGATDRCWRTYLKGLRRGTGIWYRL